jgi:hypothetical protein
MGGGKGVATSGFCFEKVEGGRATLYDNGEGNLAVMFGLRKFRHCLYGEMFEFITDHIALTWLLALRDQKERLARWIVEMQTYDFDVLNERGDGELMAVPDA